MDISRRRLSLLVPASALAFMHGAQGQDAAIGSAARPLRIGVTAGPHAQVMEKVRELGAAKGLVLQVIEFQDYIQPNTALNAGDLDANCFQHQQFLDQTVRDRGYDLVSIGKTLIFPMGMYSRRIKSLAELPDGARIAIPNDPTNGGRALVLLAQHGILTLKPGADYRATVMDIVANPKNVRIVELEAALLPRSLDDVDAAVINANYALPAGLNPGKDALVAETGGENPYANVIAVKRVNAEAPWAKKLVETYQTPEIRAFVETTFAGSIVIAF